MSSVSAESRSPHQGRAPQFIEHGPATASIGAQKLVAGQHE